MLDYPRAGDIQDICWFQLLLWRQSNVRLLDINTFYASRGGGIRTYHDAKLSWFARQDEHTYCLVCPGPKRRDTRPAVNVQVAEVRGPSVGQGYRLMVDYRSVWRLIQCQQPDVVEIGDAVPSGLVYWLTRRLWRRSSAAEPRLVTSFYHSDLIRTTIAPWADAAGPLRPLRRLAGSLASAAFYRHQRSYDVTITTSQAMQAHLASRGIEKAVRMPLGVDPIFFTETVRRRSPGEPVRLLYAGRLGNEKGIELLIGVLPKLLERGDVNLSVVGKGNFEATFAAIRHPRFTLRGFVSGRAEMAELYRQHDILLAPGPYETFGLGVLEALASGMVVVGPRAGGVGELLGQLDPAFFFAAHDVDGFYTAICRALASDLAAAGARSREVAQGYGTWDDAIARMIAHYRSLLTAAAPKAQRPPLAGPHRQRQHEPQRT